MIEHAGEIIVGVLGQWASGKSLAAKTLVSYLGGEGKTIFITDRVFLIRHAISHTFGLDYSKAKISIEDDGRQRLDSELGTAWLNPGEDLNSVDLSTLRIDIPDDIIDNNVAAWLNKARIEVGDQIRERSADGKPIVVEAGFGKNPHDHTISDFFMKLAEAGVEPKRIKWIIVEAGFDKRSKRNNRRQDTVPAHVFSRYAVDGGDLDPEYQERLEKQGTTIKRVQNDHDDIEKFRADIISAYEDLFGDV